MDALTEWLSKPTAIQIVTLISGLVIIHFAVRILRLVLNRYIRDSATRYHARKLLTLAAYFLTLIFVLFVFRKRLSGLAVFLGVAGAGIAVALREVILSIAGWLAISVGGLYKAGDRIEIAGQRGDVIDISIMRTTLMEIGQWVNSDLYNGRIVRLANSFVFLQPVFNYSGDFPFVWDEIGLPVRYGSDRQLARDIMTRVTTEVVKEYTAGAAEDWKFMLSRFRVEDARVEPMVTIAANDNWIEYTIRYVVDYKKRRTIKDMIFTRILDEIDKTEGRVKLSSSTQEIVGFPEISIKTDEDKS